MENVMVNIFGVLYEFLRQLFMKILAIFYFKIFC